MNMTLTNTLMKQFMCLNQKVERTFMTLPEDIQHVLVNMTFNLGGSRFGKFNNMWKGVVSEDWEKVAVEMEDSTLVQTSW